MARSRNIKPGFFKNEDLAELDPMCRLLFVGIWTLADKEGRLEYRPKRIKAELFPYEDVPVEEWIKDLIAKDFLIAYESPQHDTPLLGVANWKRHQSPHHKESDSVLPAPENPKAKTLAEIKLEEPIAVPRFIAEYVYERDGRVCGECGATEDITLDHVLPQVMHGLHVPGNLRPLCRACNGGRPVDGSDFERLGTTAKQLKKICLEEYKQIQEHTHACFMHERASTKHDVPAPDEPSSSRPDSLIPDSLQSDSLRDDEDASAGARETDSEWHHQVTTAGEYLIDPKWSPPSDLIAKLTVRDPSVERAWLLGDYLDDFMTNYRESPQKTQNYNTKFIRGVPSAWRKEIEKRRQTRETDESGQSRNRAQRLTDQVLGRKRTGTE